MGREDIAVCTGLHVDLQIFIAIKSDFEMTIAVIEKYSKKITQETHAIKLVDEVDAPITAKEAVLTGTPYLIQIGL